MSSNPNFSQKPVDNGPTYEENLGYLRGLVEEELALQLEKFTPYKVELLCHENFEKVLEFWGGELFECSEEELEILSNHDIHTALTEGRVENIAELNRLYREDPQHLIFLTSDDIDNEVLDDILTGGPSQLALQYLDQYGDADEVIDALGESDSIHLKIELGYYDDEPQDNTPPYDEEDEEAEFNALASRINDSLSLSSSLPHYSSAINSSSSSSSSSNTPMSTALENMTDNYSAGCRLQALKYYRKALGIFEKIKPSSANFNDAQIRIQQIRAAYPNPVDLLPNLFDKAGTINPTTQTRNFEISAAEYKRQVQTEKHFFSPARTYREDSRAMAGTLQVNRFAASTNEHDVHQAEIHFPARRAITAELATMEASLRLNGRGNPLRGYHSNAFGWQPSTTFPAKNPKYSDAYGNLEQVSLYDKDGNVCAEFTYRQRIGPHQNYLGNAKVAGLGVSISNFDGAYGQMYKFLLKLTGLNPARERMLISYMRRFTKTGIAANITELTKVYANATEDDVKMLGRIFYHVFIKEVTSRMLPNEDEVDLPLATAQARVLLLLEKRVISFKDVFSSDAKYGVFTGQNIFSDGLVRLKKKIETIHNLYMNHICKDKKVKSVSNFWSAEIKDISAREDVRNTLADVYGGDSDTDGEGYDEATANSLYDTTFKF